MLQNFGLKQKGWEQSCEGGKVGRNVHGNVMQGGTGIENVGNISNIDACNTFPTEIFLPTFCEYASKFGATMYDISSTDVVTTP